jgi:Tol biopolymer transport system component/DNA-binding winged helix-turn-helix (wHTH) protein
MPPTQDRPPCFRFGDFTLDPSSRELSRGGETLRLTAKPFDVLLLLIQNAGVTVSKSDLMAAVWTDSFVTEDNLTQAILKIRRVLGDDKDHPRFIQTIPRIGYRFVGPVTGDAVSCGTAQSEFVSPPRPSAVRGRTWAYVILTLVVAVTVGVGVWRSWRVSAVSGRSDVALPAPTRLSLPVVSATKPIFAPDGHRFLFVGYDSLRPGVGDLYLSSVSESRVERVTQGADPRGDQPVFTPDGTQLVFARWRSGDDGTRWPDLWTVPVVGGQPQVLASQASGAGFSPDGAWLAYTKHESGRTPLWLGSRAQPSSGRQLAPVGFTPRWSPDGRWIAFTTSNPEGGNGDLWIVSADERTRRKLTREPAQMYGIAWLPDSKSIVFAASARRHFHLWRVAIEGGEPTPLTGGVGGYRSPSVSRVGNSLVFSHVLSSRTLFYAPSETHAPSELSRGKYHVWPALSPDGERVASVIREPGFGEMLHVTDVAKGTSTRVSERAASHPEWLDRDRLAYLTGDSEGMQVRVVELSSGRETTWCRIPEVASWLAVHPGHRSFAAVLRGAGRQRIVVRDLDTQREVTLAEGGEYECLRWEPSGRFLSWSGPPKSAGRQSAGVWIAAIGEGAPTNVVRDGYRPVWSADGQVLFYSRIGDHSGLWRHDRRDLTSTKVRDWTEVDYFDLVGGRLVFAQVAGDSSIFSVSLAARP